MIDHVVCFDTNNHTTYDPMESYGPRVTSETFPACVSEKVELERVCDIRFVERNGMLEPIAKKYRNRTTAQRLRQRECHIAKPKSK